MKRNRVFVMATCVLSLALVACQAPSKETGFPKEIEEPEGVVEPGVIQVIDSAFDPKESVVPAGTEVRWEQIGSAPHNVVADDGSFDSHPDCKKDSSQCMGQGDEFTREFEEAGEYPYYCVIHGAPGGQGMAGTIIVQ